MLLWLQAWSNTKKLSYLQVIFLIIKLKAEIEKIVKDLADYNVTLTFATIPPVLLSKFLPILAIFSALRNLKTEEKTWKWYTPYKFLHFLCKLQKKCTRLAAASDNVYQLFAHGRWFSQGIPASSTTKTGRHDIAEILLKVALKHQKFKLKFFN